MTASGGNGRRRVGRVGKWQDLSIDKLDVIYDIQRQPTPQRINALLAVWQDSRAGMFLVARLTDGPDKGALHVTNGGTRLRVLQKKYEGQTDKIVIPCHVAEMTMEEAAIEFLSENKDAKTPHFYYQFKVGLVAQDPAMLAIERALDAVGIIAGTSNAYGNGQPGVMQSLKACERIVLVHEAAGDTFDQASDKLANVIEVCREAYTDKSAHSADLIQAVNRLITLNKRALNGVYGRQRLVNVLSRFEVNVWNHEAQGRAKMAGGGSESRATYMADVIGEEYNKRLAAAKRIKYPHSK